MIISFSCILCVGCVVAALRFLPRWLVLLPPGARRGLSAVPLDDPLFALAGALDMGGVLYARFGCRPADGLVEGVLTVSVSET